MKRQHCAYAADAIKKRKVNCRLPYLYADTCSTTDEKKLQDADSAYIYYVVYEKFKPIHGIAAFLSYVAKEPVQVPVPADVKQVYHHPPTIEPVRHDTRVHNPD